MRLACFAIATLLQAGIILTANYAFLNYLVLALGFLLLDDQALSRLGLRTPVAEVRSVPRWRLAGAAVALVWFFYATLVPWVFGGLPGPFTFPARVLSPFRIANSYGLFAVMTRARYEIEFQGSRPDGTIGVLPEGSAIQP